MERLTYFENGHWRLDFNGCQYQADFVDRLAAYEDTGLTPEEVRSLWAEWSAMMSVLNSIGGYDRLRELAEADKEGRVVVRCKDCKNSYENIGGRVCAYGVCVDCEVADDFFCAYGERRDGDKYEVHTMSEIR